MNMRRIASMLAACLVTLSISTAMGSSAQAATHASAAVSPAAILTGQFVEITPPFIKPSSPVCVDVPGGSTSIGIRLQLFHCHGYSSGGGGQRWAFFQIINDEYMISNLNSTQCLVASGTTPGSPIIQGNCLDFPGATGELWHLTSPNTPNHFNLADADSPGECMTAANSSGADHTALILEPCNPGTIFNENVLQTWTQG